MTWVICKNDSDFWRTNCRRNERNCGTLYGKTMLHPDSAAATAARDVVEVTSLRRQFQANGASSGSNNRSDVTLEILSEGQPAPNRLFDDQHATDLRLKHSGGDADYQPYPKRSRLESYKAESQHVKAAPTPDDKKPPPPLSPKPDDDAKRPVSLPKEEYPLPAGTTRPVMMQRRTSCGTPTSIKSRVKKQPIILSSLSSKNSHFPDFLKVPPFFPPKVDCNDTVEPIYLGSGWLYQKTKGTLWSPTSRDLSDSTVESPLNSIRKKLQRPKVLKIPNGILKMALFTRWFLGFTTIIK